MRLAVAEPWERAHVVGEQTESVPGARSSAPEKGVPAATVPLRSTLSVQRHEMIDAPYAYVGL